MFKIALTALAFGLGSMASAATLTYKVDYETMSDIYPEVLRECGAPETFTVDSSKEIGLQIIGALYSKGATHVWYTLPSTQTLSGVDRDPNYTGSFEHSIYNIHQDETGAEGGVVIDAFGAPGEAPKGLVITTEENLAGSQVAPYKVVNCGELWYRLEK